MVKLKRQKMFCRFHSSTSCQQRLTNANYGSCRQTILSNVEFRNKYQWESTKRKNILIKISHYSLIFNLIGLLFFYLNLKDKWFYGAL